MNDAIHAFWSWWQAARDRIERAIEIERHFSEELIADISQHVDAIGDLDWELAPGKTSKHAFCLSPKGDSQMRMVTELWRHLGPPPDATWEYFAARQAGDFAKIVFDGIAIERDTLVAAFELDRDRERVDVKAFHPGFAQMDERARTRALFVILDNTFGEDDVERWLGAIEATASPPAGARPYDAFGDAVRELARTATGEKFAVLRGQLEDGSPLFVTVNRAVKRIDHLLSTMHLAIDLAILDQNPQGLTTQTDAEQLNAIEDELDTALGDAAVYLCRETRPGHRVVHYYAPEDSGAQAIVDRWAARHAARRPQVEWMHDPAWQFARRYR